MLAACLLTVASSHPAQSSLTPAGASANTSHVNVQRVAYVIASPEHFNDGRVARLQSALGYTFVRGDPVVTNVTECNWQEGAEPRDLHVERGVLQAHRNVWAAIALSPFSQRALVLEYDFSVGKRTDEELRRKMDAAWAREGEDLTAVGWCDSCPSSHAPCWGCATAYIMHPRLANTLIANEFCTEAQMVLAGVCPDEDGSTKAQWAPSFRSQVGLVGPANCSFLYEPSMFPDKQPNNVSLRGIFQQKNVPVVTPAPRHKMVPGAPAESKHRHIRAHGASVATASAVHGA